MIDENKIFFYYQSNFAFKKNYINAKVLCNISEKAVSQSTLCIPVRIAVELTAVQDTN
jgi:hypothetical protein